MFKNFFEDICDVLSVEEDTYIEAVAVINDIDDTNAMFHDIIAIENYDDSIHDDVSVEDANNDPLSDLEAFFFGESVSDNDGSMFMEAENEKAGIIAQLKRAKDAIVRVIKMIIEQFQKFIKMIKDRIQKFFVDRKFKQQLAKAKRNSRARNSAAREVEMYDLVKSNKLYMKFAKDVIREMREVSKKYKAGKLTEDDLDKYDERFERAEKSFKDAWADIEGKKVMISEAEAIRMTETYTEDIMKCEMVNAAIKEYEQVKKEFESDVQ